MAHLDLEFYGVKTLFERVIQRFTEDGAFLCNGDIKDAVFHHTTGVQRSSATVEAGSLKLHPRSLASHALKGTDTFFHGCELMRKVWLSHGTLNPPEWSRLFRRRRFRSLAIFYESM